MKKRKTIWVIVGIILVVGIIIAIISGNNEPPIQAESGSFPTAIATLGDISISLDEVGELKPLKEVEVKSKISGKITRLYVDEGDKVQEGDIIAEVEPDMQQAQTLSRIRSGEQIAKINLETALRNYNTDKELFEKDLISLEQWTETQNNLRIAEIDYQSALTQYELIQDLGIATESQNTLAPLSGTIIQKNVEEGEMVTSSESQTGGTVLMVIADLSQMIVLVEINEIDIGKIGIGQPVEISFDAFPDTTYHGEIIHIAPMAKIGTNNIRVFETKISIENLSSSLRPGMSANVTIIGKKRENVITVPIQSIFTDELGNNIVYKISADTLVQAQIVKTGINDLEKVEIIEGLSVGDTVSLKERTPTNKANTSAPHNRGPVSRMP
ncbi:MAG: efflux RND transporter periplasmic adaptor subunit [Candidatus Cloacimonadia bacterium]